ncbi:MAG TPA: SUMF1/EgtB/PvdO family nonheme iron enzyme [Myxococcota bacterium]|nr:SUMF1/EgtB/PvdO family nonheme iron enzyme [Myxococcota bacterium]HQK51719.1 SUMF1/EgtB/PvdO family nonheme iron enzyme [Myxococcota bacterium]
MNARMATRTILGLMVLGLGGCVRERCYQDTDCRDGKVCGPSGECVYACTRDDECGQGFQCQDHRCVPRPPVTPVTCPPDMVVVADAFCVDRYEASRPDATADTPGTDGTRATSRAGVRPWLVKDNEEAQVACEAAGKRLCTPAEWETACRGPAGTVYGYGDDYDPETCNGIDTFGPGKFHLEPTGVFPECTNGWGVFDMNGNVWEHVLGGDGRTVRGGAYNCSDSRTFHRCDYVPRTWTPAALGFRCCWAPEGGPPDPGPEHVGEDVPADASGDLPADTREDLASGDLPAEGGCLPTDEGDSGAEDSESPDMAPDSEPGDAAPDPGLDLGPDPGASDSGRDAGDDLGPDPGTPPACPPDMVPVPWGDRKVTCMDRYEASRADATADSPGTSGVATSRPGVMPWHVSTMSLQALAEFTAGCQAAGKRMCTRDEWFEACNGPDDATYFFGNTWNRETCNCVDTFCDDWCAEKGISPCNTSENCGYEYYCFHVMPTGSFPNCTNAYGLFDVNGNVWEVVPSDTPRGYEVRGGAFNCGSPSVRLRCDFNATWDQLYAGFRCCKDLP